jgi:hypothetical protein
MIYGLSVIPFVNDQSPKYSTCINQQKTSECNCDSVSDLKLSAMVELAPKLLVVHIALLI